MTNSKRFAGTSAFALLIAAAFVTVSAPSSFAADRGIAVVGKKKAAKFTFEEKVSAENDAVIQPNQKKKKNFKFLVKEDKPAGEPDSTIIFSDDKPAGKPKTQFVVQDDKPAVKPKKVPKSNLIILADDKPEGSKRKPRIAQEDKIDNTLEIADLGGATRDDFDIADGNEEAPVKKAKITGKKKPVVEPIEDETVETDSGEPKEAVEDPDAEEKVVEEPEAEEKPVVKKKKVAKKKVIEEDFEDEYGYSDNVYEDDSHSYNQSYGVSYGSGYSSCH